MKSQEIMIEAGREDLMASLWYREDRARNKVVVGHVEIITLLLISANLNISSLAYLFVIMNNSSYDFSFPSLVIFIFCFLSSQLGSVENEGLPPPCVLLGSNKLNE